MNKTRSIFGALTAVATIFAAVTMPAHAADDLGDRTRILNVFNATANSAIPVTGIRTAPVDPANPPNNNLAHDWISVVANFTSTLEETQDGTLMQCATLRVFPEDNKQFEPLKSLRLPISVGDMSVANILVPKTDSGLLYGSCVPYETPLSKEQRDMVTARNWDGLAASGITISRKTIVRIMDAANKGVLQEMPIEAISDPARDSRILMGTSVQDMPSAYTLKPAL